MNARKCTLVLTVTSVALLLGGCATMPHGPTIMVMPAQGSNFDQFQADDMACRQHASRSIGATVNEAGANNVVTSAAVGTAIGAVAGAFIGGHNAVGTGAGMGLLMGSMVGAGNAGMAERDAQHRYDIAYGQCMYARGHPLPMARPSVTTTIYRDYGYRRHDDYHGRPVIVYETAPPPTVIIQHPPLGYGSHPPPGAPPPPPPAP